MLLHEKYALNSREMTMPGLLCFLRDFSYNRELVFCRKIHSCREIHVSLKLLLVGRIVVLVVR